MKWSWDSLNVVALQTIFPARLAGWPEAVRMPYQYTLRTLSSNIKSLKHPKKVKRRAKRTKGLRRFKENRQGKAPIFEGEARLLPHSTQKEGFLNI